MKATALAPYSPRRSVALAILVLAYAAALHAVYEFSVAPVYYYIGYRYRDPEPVLYVGVLVAVVALTMLMPRTLRRPSDFVLWTLYLVSTIPSMVVPQYLPALTVGKAFQFATVIAGCWLIVIAGAKLPTATLLPLVKQAAPFVGAAAAATSLLTYGLMSQHLGLSFRLVALTESANLRFGYRSALEQTGPALAYLILLQGDIVNPALMARGLYARRWSLFAVGSLGQLLIFTATGYKAMVLSVPAIGLVTLLFHVRKRPNAVLLVGGLLAICCVAAVMDLLTNSGTYTLILVNRLLLTPGVLAGAHVAVFDNLGALQWGHSFLSGYVEYNFPVDPGYLVGRYFSGNPSTSANANLFADGYMNFGYLGILIESLVLVLLLILVNSATRGLPLAVSCIVFVVPTIALANSGVFTAFLTHGYLAGSIACACLPRTGWEPRRQRASAPHAASKARGSSRALAKQSAGYPPFGERTPTDR